METDSENSADGNDIGEMDPEDAADHVRSGRDAEPISLHCGTMPEGYELNDILFPLSLQKSRSAESKYVVEYVREDKNLLPYTVDDRIDLASSQSVRLAATETLLKTDRQKKYFALVDKFYVDPARSPQVKADVKPDELQKAIQSSMSTLPATPPMTRTSVVEAALYLLDNGVLHIPDVNTVNVKQARALLWNALWLQDVMSREWGLVEAPYDEDTLADGFQLALMGPGGTGKTAVLRVTEALITYFCGPETVRKCAPSNAAARLIGGDTVHALCKLPFGNTTIDSKKGRLSVTVLNRLRKQWEAARAAFIDEVSMVAADKLHQTEVRIKSAKNLLRAFGGLGMTLSGDFLQLPPVDPSDTSKSLATAIDETGAMNLDLVDAETPDSEKKIKTPGNAARTATMETSTSRRLSRCECASTWSLKPIASRNAQR